MSDPQVRVDVRAETAQFKEEMRQAGAAVKDFSAETGRVEQPVSQAAASVGRMGAVLGALAGVYLVGYGAAVIAQIRRTIDFDDAIGKLSERLGYTAEQLSKYTFAAQAAGIPQDNLNAGLTTFAKRIDEALQGSKQSVALFGSLGISLDGLRNGTKTVDDVFVEFIDRMAHIDAGAGRTRIATQALGGAAEQMTPLFKEGAIGLKAMGDEAERTGRLVDEKATEAARKFNDELERLNRNLGGVGRTIAKDLVGPLADVIGKFNDAVGAIGLLRTLMPVPFGSNAEALANPGPRILELEQKLERLRADRASIEGSAANKAPFLRSLPFLGTVSDLAVLKLQIDNAEQELGQLKAIQNLRVEAMTRESVHRTTSPAPNPTDPPKKTNFSAAREEARSLEMQQRIEDEAKALGVQHQQKLQAEEDKRVAALLKADTDGRIKSYEAQTRAAEGQARAVADFNRKQKDSFGDLKDAVEGWGRSFSRTMGEAVVTGNLTARKIGDAFEQLAIEIAAKQIQKRITDPLVSIGTTFLDRILGGGSKVVPEAERPRVLIPDGAPIYQLESTSAMGNVLTPHGVMRLPAYGNGTIVRRPHVALIGEGEMNEAVVPLPDGRSIPVTMRGGGQQITVKIENTGSPKEVIQAQPTVTPDGIVIQVFTRDMMTGGPISQTMERTYGLGRSAA